MYAYVLVRCRMGKVKEVVEEIKKVKNVKAAYPVAGRYDAVVEVEFEGLSQLGELVIHNIQTIDGVERTETLISVG